MSSGHVLPAGYPQPVDVKRFAFAFDRRYLWILRLLAITPERAWADVGPNRLRVRFGPWRLETETSNILCATATGPYVPLRAIGPHISLKDRGISFGSNADRGACVLFDEPVPGRETFGMVKHPGLTVTVSDVEGFIKAIDEGAPARA